MYLMTKFEKRQKIGVFFSAGRNAFLIGTDIINNPYTGKFREWWSKGFLQESRKHMPWQRVPFGTPVPEKPYVRRQRREA
jgi:hypothetical protein